MQELHSIVGVFHESFPGISPWGGFIIRNIRREDRIEGMLADNYGISVINGEMTAEKLNFRKEYQENFNYAFDYEFELEEGIWKGKYTSVQKQDYTGNSTCQTNLWLKDLDFERIDWSNPEDWSRVMVQSMISKGLLVEVKESEP